MLKTLIVPCAGRSARFPGLPPKWMLRYPDGKLMAEKALEGLDAGDYGRVIFVIVKEHAEKYQADAVLEDIFHFSGSPRYGLLILDDFTSCQAETVYLALKKMGITGSFEVKDSDNYIKASGRGLHDFVAGVNIISFKKEIARLNAKSFLMVNGQGVVTDIIEKQVRSEFISVGLYGFGDVKLFCDAYEYLRGASGLGYEIYLSHVIAYLIGTKQCIYQYLEAEDYEDWGTIDDWNTVLEERKTLLINIDGILWEKGGPGSGCRQLEGNLLALKKLTDKGAQVIALTSGPEASEAPIKEMFALNGIPLHGIVSRCNLAHQVLIGRLDGTIPYPACEAINMGSQAGLGEFVR